MISECYEAKRVIIATNLKFAKWNGAFYHKKMSSTTIIVESYDTVIH